MILAFGWPPAALTAIRAFRIARVWTFTKSGIIRPSRQPRRPEHRVLLVHALDRRRAAPCPPRRRRRRLGPGDLDQLLLEVGQELVERRVDQPDDDRQAVHRPEDALEVALLEDLELGHRGVEGRRRPRPRRAVERPPAARLGLGPGGRVRDEDRAADDLQALALAEHVLGPAQADALGAVASGPWRPPRACRRWSRPPSGGSRRPSRGPSGGRAGPRTGRTTVGSGADEDLAGRAVDADPVALLEVGRRWPSAVPPA